MNFIFDVFEPGFLIFFFFLICGFCISIIFLLFSGGGHWNDHLLEGLEVEDFGFARGYAMDFLWRNTNEVWLSNKSLKTERRLGRSWN